MDTRESVDFTIVIPHRGNPLGLWATIQSCEAELKNSEYTFNYVVISNGEPLAPEANNAIYKLEAASRLRDHVHIDSPLTPPAARQMGASLANGKILFFFDNHCLVDKNYFSYAVKNLELNPNMGMIHSTTMFYHPEAHYHYQLRLDYNFWGSSSLYPESYKAYQIAAGGHGGIAVKKSVWDAVGGYGPDSLFTGYGGEELIFDLKLGRMGHEVWLEPKMIHYHFAGERGYSRHFNDEYYTNLMVSALVVGGEKWLYKLLDSFLTKGHIRINAIRSMYDLMQDAYYRAIDYSKWVDANSKYTLDELLALYKERQVPY